jgi:hypothetical protein
VLRHLAACLLLLLLLLLLLWVVPCLAWVSPAPPTLRLHRLVCMPARGLGAPARGCRLTARAGVAAAAEAQAVLLGRWQAPWLGA